MIRTILVAIDGSPISERVLAVAAEIADRFDARVLLFRAVVVPPEFPAAAHNSTVDALPGLLRQKALDELHALAAKHPRASVSEPVIETGQPWRAICKAAEDLAVDLVVIGSHGYAGWDRILGTTAGRVVNHASRDVLVVRP